LTSSHPIPTTSPCSGCAAPCCTILPVHSFHLGRYVDLDYARYLLGFQNIELGYSDEQTLQVWYRATCRQLDPVRRLCKVHRTPEQPGVCRAYDPWTCVYRSIWEGRGKAPALRLDAARLEVLAEHLSFDADYHIVAAPDRATLAAACGPMRAEDPPAAPEPCTMLARETVGEAPPEETRRWSDFAEPCTGCAAWCCDRLVFPRNAPTHAAALDHVRFCLGFPGVEFGIAADGEWSLSVRTPCRNLRRDAPSGAGRCAAYNSPSRPSVCERYDARACGFKARYGRPFPRGFVRIDADRFGTLAELCTFDGDGALTGLPDFGTLQAALATATPPA
jgi:hypothetical protein